MRQTAKLALFACVIALLFLVVSIVVILRLPLLALVSGVLGLAGLYLALPVLVLIWGKPSFWRPLSRGVLQFWIFLFEVFKLPRGTIIHLNNRVSRLKIAGARNIVVLAARCLQSSDCQLNVTRDINKCQECGRCSIAQLKRLNLQKQVPVFVESGGTAAREHINTAGPDLVLAVACERELLAGITDVSVPVLGFLLQPGSGSCKDSKFAAGELTACLDTVFRE